MSDRTGIQWTDSTWNPVRGCSRVSEGCRHCYAERIAARFSGPGQPFHGLAKRIGGEARWTGKVRLLPELLDRPLRWRKPRRIFVNSMSDLFHEELPNEAIDKVFAVMALARQHTFQVLTKRPERMKAWFEELWQGTPAQRFAGIDISAGGETGRRNQIEEACEPFLNARGLNNPGDDRLWTRDGKCKAMQFAWPLPNVWLGVSVEDQATADERIKWLLATPAAKWFISAEPLLGPIDLSDICFGWSGKEVRGSALDGLSHPNRAGYGTMHNHLDWVIAGGESGPDARAHDLVWDRSLRDQCKSAGVAFFEKQLGSRPYDSECESAPRRLRDRKGGDWMEWPADLRIRELPA